MIKLFGFSILRNGIKYDYPFHESLLSLSGICEQIYLAVGESEDNTETIINRYNFLKIIPSKWDDNLRQNGLVLSVETNKALSALRKDHQTTNSSWGFYLQADEVINEEDYQQILTDLNYASINGYDAVQFRYWHFWENYNQIAINNHWYPQEIRAIKLDTNIVSCGDAVGFTNVKKPYQSQVFIYHYGHARKQQKYQEKTRYFQRFWHSDEQIEKAYQKSLEATGGKKLFTLKYYGTHPQVMETRIKNSNSIYEQKPVANIYIVGNKNNFSPQLIQKINVKNINWLDQLAFNNQVYSNQLIIFRPNLWQKIKYTSQVPNKPQHKKATTWNNDTILMLKLSEKNLGLKK